MVLKQLRNRINHKQPSRFQPILGVTKTRTLKSVSGKSLLSPFCQSQQTG